MCEIIVTDWRPVQVYTASCPMTAGIGPSAPCDLEKDKWKRMGGLIARMMTNNPIFLKFKMAKIIKK